MKNELWKSHVPIPALILGASESVYTKWGKRALDVAVSSLGLLVLLPLFAFIGCLVKLTSAGGIFYRQTRIGRGGRRFKILKFRSMVVGGTDKGLKITVSGDSRVTSIGRVLRRYKLDDIGRVALPVACLGSYAKSQGTPRRSATWASSPNGVAKDQTRSEDRYLPNQPTVPLLCGEGVDDGTTACGGDLRARRGTETHFCIPIDVNALCQKRLLDDGTGNVLFAQRHEAFLGDGS